MTQISLPTNEQLNKLIDLMENRNIAIASVSGVSVPAGQALQVIPATDISKYVMQYINTRADAPHIFKVEFLYWLPSTIPNTHGEYISDAITVFNSEGIAKTRGFSEWFESKGGRVKVNIINEDIVDHTYDLTLYGVR